MKFFKKEFCLFLIVGFINTFITYLIYLFFLYFTSFELSYTIAFISGIIISYCLNTRFVFKKDFKVSTLMQFPLVHVTQYILGIILLDICVKLLGVHEIVAPLCVILFTIPITYLMTRFILQ